MTMIVRTQYCYYYHYYYYYYYYYYCCYYYCVVYTAPDLQRSLGVWQRVNTTNMLRTAASLKTALTQQ